jgi:hypothetical protein
VNNPPTQPTGNTNFATAHGIDISILNKIYTAYPPQADQSWGDYIYGWQISGNDAQGNPETWLNYIKINGTQMKLAGICPTANSDWDVFIKGLDTKGLFGPELYVHIHCN